MKKWLIPVTLIMVLALVVACAPKPAPPAPAPAPPLKPAPAPTPAPAPAVKEKEAVTIQWITGREGSAGYAVGATLAMLIQEELPELLERVDVRPLGSLAGVKRVEQGVSEAGYTNAMALYQQYHNLQYWAKHPTPPERRMQQGIWIYTIVIFWAVPERLAGEVKSLGDLAGRRIFLAAPGGTLFLACEVIFDAIGLFDKIEYADLPYPEVSGAVGARTIDATIVYHMAPAISPPSWLVDVTTRHKLVIIPFTEEEKAKLKEAVKGAGIALIETEAPYVKPTPVGKVSACEFYWGWGFSPDLGEEYAYAITKAIVEKAHTKSAATIFVEAFSKTPLEIMTAGIDTIPDIPVHPGVAKYLKEKGVWKDYWVVGKLTK